MGYVSVVLVRHDSLDDIEGNASQFGVELAQAVQKPSRHKPNTVMGGVAEVICRTHTHSPVWVHVHDNTAEKSSDTALQRYREMAELLVLIMAEDMKKHGKDQLNSEFSSLLREAFKQLPSKRKGYDLVGRIFLDASELLQP